MAQWDMRMDKRKDKEENTEEKNNLIGQMGSCH